MIDNTCLTLEQFVLALEPQEVLELSNLTDPLAPTINEAKVQFAIDRAIGIINGYYVTTNDCGKAYIKLQCQQLIIDIARYYLDTTKARPFVKENYDEAIRLLEYACTDCIKYCPLDIKEIETILGVTASRAGRFRGFAGSRTRVKKVGILYNDGISYGHRKHKC